MGSVIFRAGNVLARGADLTVLPCSDKGHISAETRSHLERYGLPLPGAVTFGSIQVIPFPGPSSITSWIAYAASVSNRSSVVAAIGDIGSRLGEHISAHPNIRVIESPLLGTGVGGLDVVEAGSSLRHGFEASAPLNVGRMHIHRNPIISEYMLRCACGLEIRLPQMSEASKQIVCAVIDGVARDLPAGSFASELAKAVRVFPRDAA